MTDDLTVTRGIASQLNLMIDSMIDPESGLIDNADSAFDDQVESVEFSIDRVTQVFESKREQLIRDFQALETSISEIQNISSFLTSQLGAISR